MTNRPAFAIWITGLPACGKSVITAALKDELAKIEVDVAVLESDALRLVFTSLPNYGEADREVFYRQMTWVGQLLVRHGVSVIFDATANLRLYRAPARQSITRFLEIYVDTPLDVCIARDPKGIYKAAREGTAFHVPGLQSPYEPPEAPDIVISSDGPHSAPETAALRIIEKLRAKGYL